MNNLANNVSKTLTSFSYWQEYATLWQSFMNEAIRQKHQIEMLQLDRLPKEDQGSKEVNVGSARVCETFTAFTSA